MRPSQQMTSVLAGQITPAECDDSVRSWLQLPVYNMALRVLSFETKEERREALLKVKGEELRGMVEKKARELWQK